MIARRILALIFCAALTSVAARAGAADLPRKAPVMKAPVAFDPGWSGLYLGAGVGFRSSETSVDVKSASNTALPPVLTNLFVASDCLQGLPCVFGHPFNAVTARGTVYLGYNWQFAPSWVAGLEGDLGYGDRTITRGGYYPATPFPNGSLSNSFSVKTTWDGSVRARVGYLVDPAVMVYLTAGPSLIQLQTTSNCSTLLSADGECAPGGFPGLAPASITHSQTRLGGTVGGGFEAMLWPNWIARAEYRFSDYGRITNTDVRTAATGVQTVTYNTALQTHTATFGLAYKFGDTGSARNALAAYAAVPPSSFSWTGFYIGGAVGARVSDVTADVTRALIMFPDGTSFDTFGGCRCFTGDAFGATSARFSPYIGYNWQFASQWVAGIEGDLGFANTKVTHSGNYLPGTAFFGASGGTRDAYSVATQWDASVRARLGYLINPSFLAYITGGAAWMRVEDKSTCDTALQPLFTAPGFVSSEVGACTAGLRTPIILSHSTVQPGFTAGLGGEMRLWSNWIARGEYRFSDFGKFNVSANRSCAGSASINAPNFGSQTVFCNQVEVANIAIRMQTHAAMFGIAYKFN